MDEDFALSPESLTRTTIMSNIHGSHIANDPLPYLIAKCAQEQATVLDLSDRVPVESPSSPPSTNVTNIRLSMSISQQQANSITPASRSLANLESVGAHLTTLNLQRNRLKSLPASFKKLVNLQILDLNSNKFQVIPVVVFELSALTELYLADNEITTIPEQFGLKMKQLELLDISKNQLTELPVSMSCLANLRGLDVRGNSITVIPTELSQLKHLKSIRITGNPLTSPPPVVAEKGSRAIIQYLREYSAEHLKLNSPKLRTTTLGAGQTRSTSPPGATITQTTQLLADVNDKWAKMTLTVDNTTTTTDNVNDHSLTDRKSKTIEQISLQSIQQLVADVTGADATAVEEANTAPKDAIMWSKSSRKTAQHVFSLLAEVREARKQFASVQVATQTTITDDQLSFNLFDPVLEFDSPYKIFEKDLNLVTAEIVSHIKNGNANPLLVLSQRRNTHRTNYAIAIHDRLDELKTELIEWKSAEQDDTDTGIIATATNLSKRTNDLMTQLVAALDEELEFLTRNHQKIKRQYKNRRAIRSNKGRAHQQIQAFQKLYFYLQYQMNLVSHTATPLQLSEILRGFSSLQQAAKRQNQERPDESTFLVRKYLASVQHKFLQNADTDYPELCVLYKEQVAKARAAPCLPFSAYSFFDYSDCIWLSAERNFLLAKNPYGEPCKVRMFDVSSESSVTSFRLACDFIYRNPHPNIKSLNCCWVEGDIGYIEEPPANAPTLREWLYTTNDISFENARSIIFKILSALAFLHRFGFAWGAITPDTILIDESTDGLPTPILTGFDYSFKPNDELYNEFDPVESHRNEKKFITNSADLFACGAVATMILSSSRDPPVLNADKQSYHIPKISPKLNSKHLFPFLMQLLTKHPDRRCHASHLLLHPYFTVDRSPIAPDRHQKPNSINEPLQKFYLSTYNMRKASSGIVIAEIAVGSNTMQQFMDIFYQLPNEEIIKPLVVTLAENSLTPPYTDPVLACFQELMAFKAFFYQTNSHHSSKDKSCQWILPTPNSPVHLSYFHSLGRFLCKLVVDGYSIPVIFPVAFFKMLLSRSPCSMADLESCNPKLAVQIYLNPSLIDIGLRQTEIQKFFVDCRQLQMQSIRDGFFQSDFGLQKISVLDLIALFYGRTPDNLNAETLRPYVALDGFPIESVTVEFFWRWVASIDTYTLRKFLLFASGHYTLPQDILRPEYRSSCPRHLVEGKTVTPLIIIHRTTTSGVQRPFVHHLEIPDCSDFHTFQSNMVAAMNEWLAAEKLDTALLDSAPVTASQIS